MAVAFRARGDVAGAGAVRVAGGSPIEIVVVISVGACSVTGTTAGSSTEVFGEIGVLIVVGVSIR